jgi:hypothetical protein
MASKRGGLREWLDSRPGLFFVAVTMLVLVRLIVLNFSYQEPQNLKALENLALVITLPLSPHVSAEI